MHPRRTLSFFRGGTSSSSITCKNGNSNNRLTTRLFTRMQSTIKSQLKSTYLTRETVKWFHKPGQAVLSTLHTHTYTIPWFHSHGHICSSGTGMSSSGRQKSCIVSSWQLNSQFRRSHLVSSKLMLLALVTTHCGTPLRHTASHFGSLCCWRWWQHTVAHRYGTLHLISAVSVVGTDGDSPTQCGSQLRHTVNHRVTLSFHCSMPRSFYTSGLHASFNHVDIGHTSYILSVHSLFYSPFILRSRTPLLF